jgi:hypothetical protein
VSSLDVVPAPDARTPLEIAGPAERELNRQ